MSQSLSTQMLDYNSDTYRDSFSRINGIVIEGEQEAYDNFMNKLELIEEFMVHYGESFHQIGFKTTEILRLSSQALTT